MFFVIAEDACALAFVIGSVEHCDEVLCREVFDYLINRTDESIESTSRLSFGVRHGSYCIIRAEQDVYRVDDKDLVQLIYPLRLLAAICERLIEVEELAAHL